MHALHVYKDDFPSIAGRRSLSSWDGRARLPFTFPRLLEESATALHRRGNQAGLDALAAAIPASRDLVASLRG